MPTNLNALIRYKTINNCLYGGRRKWSIDELREACSEALSEYRGRLDAVSERTLRDDIRVMRSEILGYNAPIEQEGGLYFYSDPGYSILSLRITDEGLAERIYSLLESIRTEVSHPELEIILKELCRLTKRDYEAGKLKTEEKTVFESRITREVKDADFPVNLRIKKRKDADYDEMPRLSINAREISWAAIFRCLMQ